METTETSPFVIFNHGTAIYPANNLHMETKSILNDLASFAPADAIKELMKYRPLIPITWHSVIGNMFRAYNHRENGFQGLEDLLLNILRLMTERPAQTAWLALREAILQNIDPLSGWSFSWMKEDAEWRSIKNGDDGKYYMKTDDGTTVIVLGMKTYPETRLDFISDSIMRSYGRVYEILKLFSLYAIADDFMGNPTAYPSSMRLVLADGAWYTTRYPWYRMQFGKMRSSRWRPTSNLCDPDWLAEELMARLASALDHDPWKTIVERYRGRDCQLDEDCPRQLDCTLDTNLIIGDEDEIYFKFEGRTFRWINGTPESAAILSVGAHEINGQYREEFEAMNRLLTTLVWRHDVKVLRESGVGGARRALPWTWGPRMSGGLKIPKEAITKLEPPAKTRREWLALALYKEGKNSNSIFYRYLNFWKVLEVVIPKQAIRSRWINSNVSRALRDDKELLANLPKKESISKYLYESGRCAIAHVTRSPFVDPDKVSDHQRISKDVYAVEELARLSIREVLGID